MTIARSFRTLLSPLILLCLGAETSVAEWGYCSGTSDNKIFVSNVFEEEDWYEAKGDLELQFHDHVETEYDVFMMVSVTNCEPFESEDVAHKSLDDEKEKDGYFVVNTEFEPEQAR